MLKAALQNDFNYERLILVWASMADKDIAGTLLVVAPLAAEIIFTRPESERSARPEALRDLLPEELHQPDPHCLHRFGPGRPWTWPWSVPARVT